MKAQYFIYNISVIFLLTCCSSNKANSLNNNTRNDSATNTDITEKKGVSGKSGNNKTNSSWQKMTMHEIRDKSGMVAALLPLPASWKMHMPVQNGVAITGPDGIKVTEFAPINYMVSSDPNMQYIFSQNGIKSMPLQSIQQIIQQDLIPSAKKKNLIYITHYELPQISKLDKWYSDQLYRVEPTQLYNKVYGIEMQYTDGKKAFIVMHISSTKTQYMESWYHMSALLDADPAAFETAKKQYIFALENMRYNLEPILSYNKAEAQRIGQSWAAFNQKLKASQAAFEANQIAHVNKSNAINDAIMGNWKSSNATSDKNQEQFVDYIYEKQDMQSSETGNTYKVNQGYNQYWMNNKGEYIGTKSTTYNPNLDDNMNGEKWEELKQKN